VEGRHIKVYLNYGETKVFVKSKNQDKMTPNTFQYKVAMDDFIMMSIGGKVVLQKFDTKNSLHQQLFNSVNNGNGNNQEQEKYTKNHGMILDNSGGSFMSGKMY